MLKKILAISLLITAGVAQAQSLPEPVTAYIAELDRVEKSTSPVSMEPLFVAADEAGTALMKIVSDAVVVMDSFSDAEYKALQAKLRGIQLNRGEEVYAQIDGRVLLPIAEAHGRPEDIAFFKLYRELWGENLFPVYLKPLAQPTPCVRFGEGIIPELYENWLGYARKYPKAYTELVQQTIQDLEETEVEGVCACGDLNSVLSDQRSFLKRYPDTPRASLIKARMHQIKTDPYKRPLRCH
ncbi:MAG: hypothetical protein V4607_09985 [Pseudomonadota bacterium]